MPYQKLIKMERFSKLRIKQLFDDCRIEAAHFSSIKKGKTIMQFGKRKRLIDCIKRYAHARGLLWALGYPIKKGKKPAKTTPEFRQMFKLAISLIKHYYSKYKGKVERS